MKLPPKANKTQLSRELGWSDVEMMDISQERTDLSLLVKKDQLWEVSHPRLFSVLSINLLDTPKAANQVVTR